jgi:hypothetical protein
MTEIHWIIIDVLLVAMCASSLMVHRELANSYPNTWIHPLPWDSGAVHWADV